MKPAKLMAISSAFVVALVLGACGGEKEEVELNQQQKSAMVERLAPDGEVALASEVSAAPAASGGGSRSGEDVYNSKCTACHSTGAAGAPKIGVADDWADRIAKGVDALYTSAISGLNGMPPRGLCMDCTDDELKAAVDYMLAQ